MFKLLASIQKEILILSRDKAGIAILFIMPMLLIFIITIIQDGTFKTLNNSRIGILLVNEDKDSLGAAIEAGLIRSGYFDVVKEISGVPVNPVLANKSVAEGHYQLAVIIPPQATMAVRQNAGRLTKLMLQDDSLSKPKNKVKSEVKIFFDPATKNTFKNSIVSSLEKFISEIELHIFMQSFSKNMEGLLPEFHMSSLEEVRTITITEEYATNDTNKIIPNSVQHNVPAWTMFAMFFIVIPLAGNIIREKEFGTNLRLRTMPVSYLTVFSGKLLTYLLVCILQFVLMMLVGLVFLPMLGLPVLKLGNSIAGLILIVISSGLAATGYGVLIGSMSNTREQAASFGSISVMILAAIGGIWVPVFAMPPVMRTLSAFSPLNWGLNGFYAIFLRNGGVSTVFPDVLKLLLFFGFTMAIAYYFNEYRDKQN